MRACLFAVLLFAGIGSMASAQVVPGSFPLNEQRGSFLALQEVWRADVFSAATGWTAPLLVEFYQRAGFTISQQDAQTIIDFETAGDFDASRAFSEALFSDVIASGSHSADSADAAQVSFNLIQNSIFEKVAPLAAKKKKAEEGAPAGPNQPLFGADIFYGVTDYDLFGEVETYGANLSLAWGGETQFKATLPVYQSDFGGGDITTYGLDLNVRQRLANGAAIGAHANLLSSDGGAGSSESWTAGVYGAYVMRLKDDTVFSLGALFDYSTPDAGDGMLIGAVAANLGFVVGDNVSLNPFAIYYRNFETDADWIDLGAELQFNVSETWGLNVGAKTTLEAAGVDTAYQVYLGTLFQF